MAIGDDGWSEDEYQKEVKALRELRSEATNWYKDIDGVSRKARKEQIAQINEEIDRYKELSKGTGRLAEQAKVLLDLKTKELAVAKQQTQVLGRVQQEANVTYRQFLNFLTSTAAQYNYAQQIAKEYLSVSRDIGAGAGASERLTQNYKDSLEQVMQMGGSLEDVTNIMNTMAEESGRAKILDSEDVINIESISKGLNMSASDAASMAEKFDLMGVSTDSMGNHLANVYKESQAIGLNANMVVKSLSKNMNSIQSYSFANGVKGMTEMAKQAVKMRLDVSDVLQMSDKFYQPEAAIEAAANLQMLGGDIAKAFGDPFETMYMARNKPEELAKKVGEMTENMMQFNEETGEYEMPAEARMQLKSAGEQLGINTEKMVEMARQASKIKDVKMKFTSIGDDDTKENLASLAKYSEEKGEFVIKHGTEELGLDQISDGMAEEILKANENEGKDDSELFKNIAINTQTMSEQMASLQKASMATVATKTNMYEVAGAEIKDNLLEPMKKGMDEAVKNFTTSFDPKALFKEAKWDTTFGNATKEVKEFTKALKVDLVKYIKSESESNEGSTQDGGEGSEEDFLMRENGSTVSFSTEDDIIGAKRGGPLDKLMDKGLPNKMAGGTTNSKMEFGNLNITGRIEIVSPDGSASNMEMSSIKPQIESMIINQLNGTFREGGVPSSKQSTDYMGQT